MKRTLTLTGVTVNAMALIAPGAFLWTTFQAQAALSRGSTSTAPEMWTGLFFTLILALLTAYSYAELARIYPDAGTGSTYYFAEAALLDKEREEHRRLARTAKLSIGWISHLYYWIYPGIMIAFIATLFDYIYVSLFHHQLTGAQPLTATFDPPHMRVDRGRHPQHPVHLGHQRQARPPRHRRVRSTHHHRSLLAYRLHPSGAFRTRDLGGIATPILLCRKASVADGSGSPRANPRI